MSGTGGYVAVVVDSSTGKVARYGDDYKSKRRAERKADKMAEEMNNGGDGVVDDGSPECQIVLC
jgi:hypothetical protein